MIKIKFTFFVVLLLLLFAVACSKITPKAPPADTVMDAPLDGMTYAQYALFNQGAEEFDETYTTETGLGPIYVSTSCASCHTGDNRGHAFTALTRFGQSDTLGNSFLSMGGPQLQNRAIAGHTSESIPSGATSSIFLAPVLSGLGFLELVPDSDIIAMAQANLSNADGVRGHPNWNSIPSTITPHANAISMGGKYICRFGRKASTFNMLQQAAGAFNQDMGVTTTYFPQNPFNYLEGLQPAPGAEPEVSDKAMNGLVFYLQTLQTPIQRNVSDPDVVAGKAKFISIGCEACHKQTLKTGYSPVAPLSLKEFHPYTDLLVHDMGKSLDDGYTEGSAKTSEWRTTPLWGLGLASDAQGGNLFLLHDGRARSIEDAILMHGGESEISKSRFANLSASEKEQVIKFLKSL